MFYYSNDIMLTNKSTPDNNLHPFHCIGSSHNKSKEILLTNYINSILYDNNNINNSILYDNNKNNTLYNLYDNILISNNIILNNILNNIPFNTLIYGCIYMNRFLLTNQDPLTNKISFINYLRVCMVIASKYTCDYIIDYSIILSDSIIENNTDILDNNITDNNNNNDNNILDNTDIFNYEIIILSNINYNLIVSEEEYTKILVEYFIK